MISIIAAIDSQRGLGKDNKLLWYLPEDLKRFKELTTGHPVIMGRKTFESIGKALPNRTNIVVTQNPGFSFEGVKTVSSIEEAIEEAGRSLGSEEIFVIGGGQIYSQAISKADRLYLTLVEGDFGADVFFPDYSEFTNIISEQKGESGDLKYTFLILQK